MDHAGEAPSSLPIGRPISNTQVYILDAHGVPLPIGVTGELYIGGAGVARGYLNRPELTSEKYMGPLSSSLAAEVLVRPPSLAICFRGSIGAIRKKPGDQLRLADGLSLKTLTNYDSLSM